jgi:cell wall-associated NlpC family hydrolase
VPTGLVAALAAPIRQMRDMVGSEWSGDPFSEPGAALRRTCDALADVAAASRGAWVRAGGQWSGAGADGAAAEMASLVASIDGLADHAGRMSAAVGSASAAVGHARERLADIVDRFEARATALEPYLDEPAVMKALTDEATQSLAEAVAVVEGLQDELDGQAATLSGPPPSSAPVPTSPAGMGSPAMPGMGSALGGAPALDPMSGSGGGSGLGGLIGDLVKLAPHDATAALADPASFGDGIAVRLPDGSTTMAPNAVAANAVRYALTQLGVPYDWGGTSPGVGLDCSGLTQWAYSEAGLNLPRLAQEQDVGAPVNPGALRPGDLAVWDGHVAMIVGNGTMIEAGDPVKLSPIRTTNAGQGFQGFWRPTA